jgi:hypothetical protein
MRRFFTWMVFGALTGVVVATALAPAVLRTLLASTGAQDAMCQCVELVNNTASLLIKTQIWGAIVGATSFPAGAWLVKRMWTRRKGQTVPANKAPQEPNGPSAPV